MAENERLDLRRSRRWLELGRRIRDGEPDESITDQIIRNLYRTFQGVVKQIPLRDLLEAAHVGGDLAALVKRCQGHDYARLVELEARRGLDRQVLTERVLSATFDKFLDQIRMRVVASDRWPDFDTFNAKCDQWKQAVRPAMRSLARKLVGNPDQAPRTPPMSAERREQERRAQLHSSILGPRLPQEVQHDRR